MENFTPFSALIGGTLIGLSVAMMILFNGRIAGISGVSGGLLTATGNDLVWRLVFLLGLIGGAMFIDHWLPMNSSSKVDTPLWLLISGGFLVGFGSRLGNGCTSGHGVCGIARLSGRSVIATLTFMGSAALTVYIMRHIAGAMG